MHSVDVNAERSGLPKGGLGERQRPNGLIMSIGSKRIIHWPTDQELANVSEELRRISQIGICSEASGDYFTSGDIAYQLQEIVRSTSELLKKSVKKSLCQKAQ